MVRKEHRNVLQRNICTVFGSKYYSENVKSLESTLGVIDFYMQNNMFKIFTYLIFLFFCNIFLMKISHYNIKFGLPVKLVIKITFFKFYFSMLLSCVTTALYNVVLIKSSVQTRN